MDLNRFIFSEKRSDRIKRHLFFWVINWGWLSVSHLAQPFNDSIAFFRNPVYGLTESFLFTTSQMPIVYFMLYFFLPKLILKERYFNAFLTFTVLWFLGGVSYYFMFKDVFPFLLSQLPVQYLQTVKRLNSVSFFMGVTYMIKGVLAVSCIAMAIKFAKYWYLKEQRNIQLLKENTEAQLQLLTAQVHPHFLFNTLNNIYSQAQNESPKSSKMIMGLSDLLRYILYEGRKPLVPLDKELQMMLEYINLEKIRYGNKLDMHYLVTDKTENVYITPLLLIPFIENCFKHGASNMLQNPWITLTIEVKDTTLVMKLMNGKAANNGIVPKKQGIGLTNVRKRLELLYKDKHELQIREEEDVFIVDLKIELVKMLEPQQIVSQTAQEILYA